MGADPRPRQDERGPGAGGRRREAGDEEGDLQDSAPGPGGRNRGQRRTPRRRCLGMIVGLDIGSTTVKASVEKDGEVLWKDYQRHNTKQAEKVLEFLDRIEAECGFRAS